MRFGLKTTAQGDSIRMVVTGELTLETAGALREAVAEHVTQELVLDLSEVTFLDSVGLSVIVRAVLAVQEAGGRLVLARELSPAAARAIDLACLRSSLTFAD